MMVLLKKTMQSLEEHELALTQQSLRIVKVAKRLENDAKDQEGYHLPHGVVSSTPVAHAEVAVPPEMKHPPM